MAELKPFEFIMKIDFGANDGITAVAHAEKVAELVRCKDCVHLEILNGSTYYARCGWHGRLFESFGRADTRTWFCADGERRTDNA